MGRKTQARLAIAAELLRSRASVQWGYELSKSAGVGPGSMYPYLTELLEGGFLEDGWETPADARGRPARRYYRVTEAGERHLRDFLQVGGEPSRRRERQSRRAPGFSAVEP